jgi:hypothetical protein
MAGGTRMVRIWRKLADFSTALIWSCDTEIRKGARRGTKGLFWNTDGTDLAETRGFFNYVVFNNCVENLRIITDFLVAARPFRFRGSTFAAIYGFRLSSVSLGMMPMISATINQ